MFSIPTVTGVFLHPLSPLSFQDKCTLSKIRTLAFDELAKNNSALSSTNFTQKIYTLLDKQGFDYTSLLDKMVSWKKHLSTIQNYLISHDSEILKETNHIPIICYMELLYLISVRVTLNFQQQKEPPEVVASIGAIAKKIIQLRNLLYHLALFDHSTPIPSFKNSEGNSRQALVDKNFILSREEKEEKTLSLFNLLSEELDSFSTIFTETKSDYFSQILSQKIISFLDDAWDFSKIKEVRIQSIHQKIKTLADSIHLLQDSETFLNALFYNIKKLQSSLPFSTPKLTKDRLNFFVEDTIKTLFSTASSVFWLNKMREYLDIFTHTLNCGFPPELFMNNLSGMSLTAARLQSEIPKNNLILLATDHLWHSHDQIHQQDSVSLLFSTIHQELMANLGATWAIVQSPTRIGDSFYHDLNDFCSHILSHPQNKTTYEKLEKLAEHIEKASSWNNFGEYELDQFRFTLLSHKNPSDSPLSLWSTSLHPTILAAKLSIPLKRLPSPLTSPSLHLHEILMVKTLDEFVSFANQSIASIQSHKKNAVAFFVDTYETSFLPSLSQKFTTLIKERSLELSHTPQTKLFHKIPGQVEKGTLVNLFKSFRSTLEQYFTQAKELNLLPTNQPEELLYSVTLEYKIIPQLKLDKIQWLSQSKVHFKEEIKFLLESDPEKKLQLCSIDLLSSFMQHARLLFPQILVLHLLGCGKTGGQEPSNLIDSNPEKILKLFPKEKKTNKKSLDKSIEMVSRPTSTSYEEDNRPELEKNSADKTPPQILSDKSEGTLKTCSVIPPNSNLSFGRTYPSPFSDLLLPDNGEFSPQWDQTHIHLIDTALFTRTRPVYLSNSVELNSNWKALLKIEAHDQINTTATLDIGSSLVDEFYTTNNPVPSLIALLSLYRFDGLKTKNILKPFFNPYRDQDLLNACGQSNQLAWKEFRIWGLRALLPMACHFPKYNCDTLRGVTFLMSIFFDENNLADLSSLSTAMKGNTTKFNQDYFLQIYLLRSLHKGILENISHLNNQKIETPSGQTQKLIEEFDLLKKLKLIFPTQG